MMAKCGIGRGKCDKECAEVSLEEHIACQCECTLTDKMCTSETHSFNSDMCKCQCKDIIGKRECLDQGKVWDENSCKCGCSAFFSISIGTALSKNTCEVIEKDTSNNNIKDNRIPRSNDITSINTWNTLWYHYHPLHGHLHADIKTEKNQESSES